MSALGWELAVYAVPALFVLSEHNTKLKARKHPNSMDRENPG